MTALERVLDRLEAVKATGEGRWSARCPAHDDRQPSLSVSQGDDGRVLVHCHSGCRIADVLSELGLTEAELFERRNGDGQREIVAEYPYTDEDGNLLYEVVRFHPKDFRQRRPDGQGGWEWNLRGLDRVLYRLPEVVEAAKAGSKVAVVEGEKDADALAERGIVATTGPGGAGKWRSTYGESLRGAKVAIIADADEPGRRHARQIADSLEGIAAEVKLLEPAEGCKDVSDHLAAGHRLSELIPVEEAMPEADQGPPPDTAVLLASIANTIRRYVVVTDTQRDLIALWVLHAHAVDAADTTPYLNISSAEKQSGKSRLLEVLAQLAPRVMEAANVSDAALFRALADGAGPATLLYDEVDSLFGRNASTTKEEQRGLLNAGYRRGAVAWRCEGDGSKQTVTPYPVFGPKALAGIGELPETLADRSIPIRLRRRRPDEVVERGRYRAIVASCEPLKTGAERWAHENVERLQEADPELPDELSDRAQDGAEPLLAIADLAGGEWPERARKALVELHADKAAGAESCGVQLLAAIRDVFADDEQLPTAELIERLGADEEAPWGTWGKTDAGLTPRTLATLLKPYRVTSGDVHVEYGEKRKTLKGYKRAAFEDAWDRYLPAVEDQDEGEDLLDSFPYTHPRRAIRANGSSKPRNGPSYPRQEGGMARIGNPRKSHQQADGADGAAEMHNGEPKAATEDEEREVARLAAKMGENLAVEAAH